MIVLSSHSGSEHFARIHLSVPIKEGTFADIFLPPYPAPFGIHGLSIFCVNGIGAKIHCHYTRRNQRGWHHLFQKVVQW
jgi:hypothetical protein